MDRAQRSRDDGKTHPSDSTAVELAALPPSAPQRGNRVAKTLILFYCALLILSFIVMYLSHQMFHDSDTPVATEVRDDRAPSLVHVPFGSTPTTTSPPKKTPRPRKTTRPRTTEQEPIPDDTLETLTPPLFAEHSTHITLGMSSGMSEAWKTSSERLTFDTTLNVVNHRTASENESSQSELPFVSKTSTHSGTATFYGKSSLKLKYTSRRSLHIQLKNPLKLMRPQARDASGATDHREEVELTNFLLLSLWEDTYRLSYRSAIDYLKEHQLFFAYSQLVEVRCVPEDDGTGLSTTDGKKKREHVCTAPDPIHSSSPSKNGVTLGIYLLLEYPSTAITRFMNEACTEEMEPAPPLRDQTTSDQPDTETGITSDRRESTFPGFLSKRQCEHPAEHKKRLELWRNVMLDTGKTSCNQVTFETSVRNWFYWKKPAIYDLIHVPSYAKNSTLSTIYRMLETDSALYGVHDNLPAMASSASPHEETAEAAAAANTPDVQEEAFFDLPQYYKWLAVNTLLGNGDYDDEVFFFGVSETTSQTSTTTNTNSVRPRRFLSMMAWDYDTVFANCHRPPKVKLPRQGNSNPTEHLMGKYRQYAPTNPEALLFCAETPLESAIVRVDSLRQRYYDTMACMLSNSVSPDGQTDERARWRSAVLHSQREMNAILSNIPATTPGGGSADNVLDVTFGELNQNPARMKKRVSDTRSGVGAAVLLNSFNKRYESIRLAFGDDVNLFHSPSPIGNVVHNQQHEIMNNTDARQKSSPPPVREPFWNPALFPRKVRLEHAANVSSHLRTERNIVEKRGTHLEKVMYSNINTHDDGNVSFTYQKPMRRENAAQRVTGKSLLQSKFPATMQVAGVLRPDFSKVIATVPGNRGRAQRFSPDKTMDEAGLFCLRVAVAVKADTPGSTPPTFVCPSTVDSTTVGAAEAAVHRSHESHSLENGKVTSVATTGLSDPFDGSCGGGGVCPVNTSDANSWSKLCTRAREETNGKTPDHVLIDVPIVLRSNERGAAEYGLREYVKPPPPTAPFLNSQSAAPASHGTTEPVVSTQQSVSVDILSPGLWPASAGWFPAVVRLSRSGFEEEEGSPGGDGSFFRGRWLRRNAAIQLSKPQHSGGSPSQGVMSSTTIVRGFCAIRLVRDSHQDRFTDGQHGPLLHLSNSVEQHGTDETELLVHSIEGLPGASAAHAIPPTPQWISSNSIRSNVSNGHVVPSGSVLTFSTAQEAGTAARANTFSCPVRIEGLLVVESGASVVIEPGCGVVMAKSARIDVEGTIVANGTRKEPIVFMGDPSSDSYTNDAAPAWDTIYIRGPQSSGSFLYTFFTGSGVPGMLVQLTGKHHSRSSAITVTHHGQLTLYASFFIGLAGPALSAGNPDIQNAWLAAPDDAVNAATGKDTHMIHSVIDGTENVAVTSEIIMKHTVVQWAEMGLECVNCGVLVALSTSFLLFPSWDNAYADKDNDALYLSGGMHVVSDCVIAHTKDDGIDSGTPQQRAATGAAHVQLRIRKVGSHNHNTDPNFVNSMIRATLRNDVLAVLSTQSSHTEGGETTTGTPRQSGQGVVQANAHDLITVDTDFLLLRSSIIEYCQHEGVALSSSPKAARTVRIEGVVVQHCQQCIEVGYASYQHIATVSRTFIHHCVVGVRYGDNYMDSNQHGQLTFSQHVHFVGNEVNVLHYIRNLRAPHAQPSRYFRAEVVQIGSFDSQKEKDEKEGKCRWGSGVTLWPDGRHRIGNGNAIGWCEELYQLPLIIPRVDRGGGGGGGGGGAVSRYHDAKIKCGIPLSHAPASTEEDILFGYVTTHVKTPPKDAYTTDKLEELFFSG